MTHPSNVGSQRHKGAFLIRFKANRAALISTYLFIGLLLVSIFANVVANDRPVVMSYKGQLYAPAFKDYRPEVFGLEGFVVDYLALEAKINQEGWALWPPIKHRVNDPNLNFPEIPAPPGAVSTLDLGDGKTIAISHPIGTDTAGRDLLTRLIYGCQTSLLMAIATTGFALIVGIFLGLIMGFKGGWIDMILGRVLESIGYFPVIFMIIILVAFIETPSIWSIIGIFVVLNIAPFAFYTRGQVLAVRQLTFVEAATSMGQRTLPILIRHILPNSLGPIMVLVPFSITSDISFLATIDFLGFGVQPPTASLGAILRSGFDQVEHRWWLIFYASIVLVLVLILINFIGDGIRDGFDPYATISKKAFKRWEDGLSKKKPGVATHYPAKS